MSVIFTGTDGWFYRIEGDNVRSFHTANGRIDGQRDMENLMTLGQFEALARFLGFSEIGVPVTETKEAEEVQPVVLTREIVPPAVSEALKEAYDRLTAAKLTEIFDGLQIKFPKWDELGLADKRITLLNLQMEYIEGFADEHEEAAPADSDL